jgi:hypothetical protein
MPERITMIEQTLFSLAGTPDFDLDRTGGMHVAVDETLATTVRIQLDDTSWVDHIQGWLAGDDELMEVLMSRPPGSSARAGCTPGEFRSPG